MKKEDNVNFLFKCLTYAAHRTEIVAHLSQLMPQIQDKFQNPTKRNPKALTEMLIHGTLDEDWWRFGYKNIFHYCKLYYKNRGLSKSSYGPTISKIRSPVILFTYFVISPGLGPCLSLMPLLPSDMESPPTRTRM